MDRQNIHDFHAQDLRNQAIEQAAHGDFEGAIDSRRAASGAEDIANMHRLNLASIEQGRGSILPTFAPFDGISKFLSENPRLRLMLVWTALQSIVTTVALTFNWHSALYRATNTLELNWFAYSVASSFFVSFCLTLLVTLAVNFRNLTVAGVSRWIVAYVVIFALSPLAAMIISQGSMGLRHSLLFFARFGGLYKDLDTYALVFWIPLALATFLIFVRGTVANKVGR